MDYGVIDARVSTEMQERGYSLDGQVKAGLAYAEKHDIFVPPEYIFQESHTGTDIDRPAIMQIRQAIKDDKRIKYIIVYSLDRLARTALGLLLLEKEFRKAGLKVVYIKYEFDDTPEGQLQKQIYAAFSEFEKATIVHRFTKGKRDKVAAGQYLGGHNSPYGYYNDMHASGDERRPVKTNFLKVNKEEARILRYVFEWLAYGDEDGIPLTATAVARKLTQMRVPTPFVVRCPKYKKRKTPIYQWSPQAVINIVRNEVYCTGIWFYGKTQRRNGVTVSIPREEWVSVQVPTLIDGDLWRAAVCQLDLNKLRTAPASRYSYLVATRITCAICGRRMYGTTTRCHLHYYYCSGHYQRTLAFDNSTACTSRRVLASAIDDLVWNWLHELFADPARILDGLKERQAQQCQQHALSIDRLESINEELSRIHREMKALMMGFAKQNVESGSPAFKVYNEAIVQYNSQAERLEEERAKIESKLDKVVISDDALARAKRALESVDTVFQDGDVSKRLAFINMLDVHVVVKAEKGKDDVLVEANCCITSSGVMHLADMKLGKCGSGTHNENAEAVTSGESSSSYART